MRRWAYVLLLHHLTLCNLELIKVVSHAYLRLLFLATILIPACESPSPLFCIMYSAYKLNKQGDIIQTWHIPFPVLNQSVVPCTILTVASCPAYRFLKRQVRDGSDSNLFENFPQFVVIHAIKGFSVVNEAEVDVLGEFLCFFYDPADAGYWVQHFHSVIF